MLNKLTRFLISSVLLFGAAACDNNVARTDSKAPDNVNETIGIPSAQEARDEFNL